LGTIGATEPIPADRLLAAAQAASEKAVCAGHVRNANLAFAWEEVAPPAPKPVAVVAPAAPAEPEATDEHGIPLSTLRALEAEENARDEARTKVTEEPPAVDPSYHGTVVTAEDVTGIHPSPNDPVYRMPKAEVAPVSVRDLNGVAEGEAS
jgi:hypothetical protein